MKLINFTASALFVVLVGYLLVVGEALLLPLVIAIALWYLVNTLAASFGRIRIGAFSIPRPLCLTASIISFLVLLWALINFLSGRVNEVMEVVPLYQENLTQRLQALPFVDAASFEEQSLDQMVGDWIDLPAYATSVATSFAGILANGGLILIYMLFLFLEQGHFDKKLTALVGNNESVDDARKIIERIRNDIQKYISIKFFTSSLTGILSYILMRILDVDFASVWGLLIFLLNFIPTVGSIIATIFPAMIALAQSDGYALFFFVLLGIGALQMCIGNILEPRLMGNSFNLSPIVILLNLAFWGSIWGVPGAFLCVPFLIIITIILSHFPHTRPIAVMLSSDGKLRVPLEKTLEGFAFNPSASGLLHAEQDGESRGGHDSDSGKS